MISKPTNSMNVFYANDSTITEPVIVIYVPSTKGNMSLPLSMNSMSLPLSMNSMRTPQSFVDLVQSHFPNTIIQNDVQLLKWLNKLDLSNHQNTDIILKAYDEVLSNSGIRATNISICK